MFKRAGILLAEFLLTIVIILFFSTFGQSASLLKGIHGAYWLIAHTIAGEQLRANYSGISWGAALASIRLITMGTAISVAIGFLYALFSFQLRFRWARELEDLIASILQSLPEAMYVIVVFIGLVILLQNGINLPGLFHDGLPRIQDTFAPAFALAIPGIFYLRRIMTLRLYNESNAQYVSTAMSKGLSERKVFYRHVLPNVLPTLYRQLPVVAGFVISNALFAEFFLGYMALLFRVPMFAGWDMITGALGLKRAAGIPPFQSGAIFVAGILLVTSWFVFAVISELLQMTLPPEIETVANPTQRKVDIWWIIAGTVLIVTVIFFSIFPHLLTIQNATTVHLINTKNMTFPPYPPSETYPMGTDLLGRDLLARTLIGTLPTITDVLIITGIVLIGSVALATFLAISQKPFISRLTTQIGRILSALPTLFILFLAMYHRNMHSPIQGLQYILWVALFESGRGAIAFYGAMRDWFNFGFIEGAKSIGQTRFSILYRQLRSWFGQFTLEFTFTEFTRILSLMTLLAMFHTYPVEEMVYGDNGISVGSAQITWFSMLGDAANQVFSIVTYPFLIYSPVFFLIITMLGASFIAHGLRGKP